MAFTSQDITNLEDAIKKIIDGKRTVSFTTMDTSYTYQDLKLDQARKLLAEMKIEADSESAVGDQILDLGISFKIFCGDVSWAATLSNKPRYPAARR